MLKILIVLAFLLILISLGKALFSMLKGRSGSDHTIKALSWRIGLSVGLFIVLILAYSAGLISPHGLYTRDL